MFCFVSFAFAHPFDAELYGHDLEVSLLKNTLHVTYRAEVPYQVVQQELRELLEDNRHIPLDDLRTQYLSNRYGALQQGLSLQIDGQEMSWENIKPFPQKLKKEGQFLRFQVQLSHNLSVGAHQISIWNQNYREQLSVYRSDIRYDNGVWIDEHDVNEPQKWSKEKSMQELRMSFRFLPSIWSQTYKTWSDIIQDEDVKHVRSAPQPSILLQMKRRKIPLEIAFLSCFLLALVSFFSPMNRNFYSLGQLLILIGVGMALEQLGDARLPVGMVLGLICAIRSRALALFFWLQICLPWWLVLIFVLPIFVRSVERKDYIS